VIFCDSGGFFVIKFYAWFDTRLVVRAVFEASRPLNSKDLGRGLVSLIYASDRRCTLCVSARIYLIQICCKKRKIANPGSVVGAGGGGGGGGGPSQSIKMYLYLKSGILKSN